MTERPTQIAVLRAKRGLTQAQLSELAGVSRDSISAIESRQIRRVRLTTLARLAGALGVELEELLGPEEGAA